jgi:hypothetical protein
VKDKMKVDQTGARKAAKVRGKMKKALIEKYRNSGAGRTIAV